MHGGQHLHGDAGRLGHVEDLGDQLRRRIGYGEKHLLDGVPACGCWDVADAPDDRNPYERHSVHRSVIVEHGDRNQPGVGMTDHLAHRGRGFVTAPDYRHPQSVASRAALPGEDPRLEADQTHAQGRQDQADDEYLSVDHLKPRQLDRAVDDEQEGGDRPAGEDYLTGFFEPGVTPHTAVQAVDLVTEQGDEYHDEEEKREVPAVRRWCDVAPEEDLRSAVARQDTDGVQHHEEELRPHPAGENRNPMREVVPEPVWLPAPSSRVPARWTRARVLSSRHPDHRRRSERCQSLQSVALRPRLHVAPTSTDSPPAVAKTGDAPPMRPHPPPAI